MFATLEQRYLKNERLIFLIRDVYIIRRNTYSRNTWLNIISWCRFLCDSIVHSAACRVTCIRVSSVTTPSLIQAISVEWSDYTAVNKEYDSTEKEAAMAHIKGISMAFFLSHLRKPPSVLG